MSDGPSQPGRPRDRRQFFRQGFGYLLRPVAGYVEQRFNLPIPRTLLRPPGALPEQQFLETCYRCGNCGDACPAHAIKLHPGGGREDESVGGTPVIDAGEAACVVCDDIACTKACPAGALEVITDPADIHMGLAIVEHGLCLRTKGEDCRECVERCPIGAAAITLSGRKKQVEVSSSGCVGCGVCEQYCPTSPKAIMVDPV